MGIPGKALGRPERTHDIDTWEFTCTSTIAQVPIAVVRWGGTLKHAYWCVTAQAVTNSIVIACGIMKSSVRSAATTDDVDYFVDETTIRLAHKIGSIIPLTVRNSDLLAGDVVSFTCSTADSGGAAKGWLKLCYEYNEQGSNKNPTAPSTSTTTTTTTTSTSTGT